MQSLEAFFIMNHQQRPSDTPFPALTTTEVCTAADAAFSALRAKGIPHACLFGSAACVLHGMKHRVPRDVDLVVFNANMDEEALKRTIHSADTRFRLVSSKNPKKTYKILYYTLSSAPPRHCKVDILIPGLLEIPRIPQEHVVLCSHATFSLPVMPLFPLLLLKLRGWDDHRNARAAHLHAKTGDDIKDIDELLAMAVARQACAATWLPETLVVSAGARVREYVKLNHNESHIMKEVTPRRISEWVAIGVSNEAILQEDVRERVRFLQERRDQKAAARKARLARRAQREGSTQQPVAGTTSTGSAATAPRHIASTLTGSGNAASKRFNQVG
ncbi:hypothetical protein BDZ89DRAFT_121829 [Hymenopellis radicata]|nr:hypothetical protein BDZ89DRAFT_121829 [Hymenopellis radicata]